MYLEENKMIAMNKYFDESTEMIANLIKNPQLAKAATQASVWGVGSALGTKLSSSKKKKHMSQEEKKQLKRQLIGTGVAGALAGAAGSLV
jgi:hypothetical protein